MLIESKINHNYGSIITKAASNNSTLFIVIYLLFAIPHPIEHLFTNIHSKKFKLGLLPSYLPEISFRINFIVVPS
tara:strand:+ start:866 stop:1090 length:225 start_codon:yes stop_codon:yes gene_type:complete